MKSILRPLASVVMLSLLMVGAFASDLTTKAPRERAPVVGVYNWSGFYVGVNGGFGVGASGASVTPFSALVPNDPADRMKGWLVGGQVGVRNQSGRIVYGLEADLDWTNIQNQASACSTARRTFFATQLADTTSCQSNGTKINWLSTVTGNIGVTLWDRTLLSFIGGLAGGQVKTANAQSVSTATLTPTGVAFCNAGAISCPNGSGAASDNKTMWGWTIGAALETALGDRWTMKGQYNFIDLGSINSAAMGGQKVDVHVVKFGLNVRL